MPPGSSIATFGTQPGRDDLLLGRIGGGAASPDGNRHARWPVPGAEARSDRRSDPTDSGSAPLLYGSLELPAHETEEGPPEGLTLDQAIDLLKRQNLDLRAKQLEIPQARADVLTASLRQSIILCRQPACSVRVRLVTPAGWAYTVRCQLFTSDRLCSQTSAQDRIRGSRARSDGGSVPE